MTMEDCPIQLVDMPPITADYIFPDAFDLVRSSDLIFWVIDLSSESWVEDSQAVLNRFLGSKTRLGRYTGPLSNEVGITSTQTLIVLNKIDLPSVQANIELLADFVKTEFDRVSVSGVRGDGLVALRHEAFQRLDIVRVYAKDPRQREADRKTPFFLKRGESLVEFARQIHGDLASKLKSARVWGRDAADCAIVKPDYQPCDQDVIELQTST
jgi:ribosome-interacting GTPase 1